MGSPVGMGLGTLGVTSGRGCLEFCVDLGVVTVPPGLVLCSPAPFLAVPWVLGCVTLNSVAGQSSQQLFSLAWAHDCLVKVWEVWNRSLLFKWEVVLLLGEGDCSLILKRLYCVTLSNLDFK